MTIFTTIYAVLAPIIMVGYILFVYKLILVYRSEDFVEIIMRLLLTSYLPIPIFPVGLFYSKFAAK